MEPIQPSSLILSPFISRDEKSDKIHLSRGDSDFQVSHRPSPHLESLPHYYLRYQLIKERDLDQTGNLHKMSPLYQTHEVSVSPLQIEEKLKSLLFFSFSSFHISVSLKELITEYLAFFPHHDIHGIGSYLPLDKHWSFVNIKKNTVCNEKTKQLMTNCAHADCRSFADIDLRFMIPLAERDKNGFLLFFTEFLKKKLQDGSITSDMVKAFLPDIFSPSDGIEVMTFKGENGYPDVDIIFCYHAKPPYLTTQDSHYISYQSYLKNKEAALCFSGKFNFGDYFVHKLAKILVFNLKQLNDGAFKRLIQFQTMGYITPQKGVIEKIVTEFLFSKRSCHQFFSVFENRLKHLSSNPKTEIAFCLNLISCVEEYFSEEDKLPYWKMCADLITQKQSKLFHMIAIYIKAHFHGCKDLLHFLKICFAMTYMTLKSRSSDSYIKYVPPVYLSTQNGEPNLSLSINHHSTIHLKLDLSKTLIDLNDCFLHFSKHSVAEPRRKQLVKMMKEFLSRLIKVELKREGPLEDTVDLLRLGFIPHTFQKILSYQKMTADPTLHLLNLYWKLLFISMQPKLKYDESDVIRSIAPALEMFSLHSDQKLFLKKMKDLPIRNSVIFPEIVKKLDSFESKMPLSVNLKAVFEAMGSSRESKQQGYQIWLEAIDHPAFESDDKILSLKALTQELSPPIFIARFDRHFSLEPWTASKIILDQWCSHPSLVSLIESFLSDLHSHESLPKEKMISLYHTALSKQKKIPNNILLLLVEHLLNLKCGQEAKDLIVMLDERKLTKAQKKIVSQHAKRILNFFLSNSEKSETVNCYKMLKGKGLLKPDINEECALLSALLSKIKPSNKATPKIGKLLLDILINLNINSPLLQPKVIRQLRNILNEGLPKLSFEEKIACLENLCRFNRTGSFPKLESIHQSQLKQLMRTSLPEEVLQAASRYAKIMEWQITSELLCSLSHKNKISQSDSFYALSLEALNRLNFTVSEERSKGWKLLISCYPRLENDDLYRISKNLIKESQKEFPAISDVDKTLTSLVIKLHEINPQLAFNLFFLFSDHKVRLTGKSSLLALAAMQEPDLGWKMYRIITEETAPSDFYPQKVHCLGMLLKSLKNDHIEWIMIFLEEWKQLGISNSDKHIWLFNLQKIIEQKIFDGDVHQMLDLIRTYMKISSDEHAIRTFLSYLFDKFYHLYCREQKIDPKVFFEIWKRYQTKYLDKPEFYQRIIHIFLNEGRLIEAWKLQIKKETLRVKRNRSMTALQKNIERHDNWIWLFRHSAPDAFHPFVPRVHKLFLDCVIKNICPNLKNLSDRQVAQKVSQWKVLPDYIVEKLNNEDEDFDQVYNYYEARLNVIDSIIIGIWGLTHDNAVSLDSRMKKRLHIVAAILWMQVSRKTKMDLTYPSFVHEFNQILLDFQDPILDGIEDDIRFEGLRNCLIEAGKDAEWEKRKHYIVAFLIFKTIVVFSLAYYEAYLRY